VVGLDASGELQEESVTMDGTNNVATANTYTNIHRMYVLTAGSGGENAGTITATADTDSTVTAQINAGNNQTLMAIYQVPSDKTAYLLRWYVGLSLGGGASGNADMVLLAKPTGAVYQTKRFVGVMGAASSSFTETLAAPPSFAASTILKIQANEVSVSNMDIFAGFDLLLVDN
jgi:hypothetical protein